jgi:hypothetical protein
MSSSISSVATTWYSINSHVSDGMGGEVVLLLLLPVILAATPAAGQLNIGTRCVASCRPFSPAECATPRRPKCLTIRTHVRILTFSISTSSVYVFISSCKIIIGQLFKQFFY